MDNIKEELNKNKDIKVGENRMIFIFAISLLISIWKDNIKKFRDQAKKLEDSDALKEARDKYVSSNEIYIREDYLFGVL